MKTFIGIDLGSTTTKAVVIDEARNVPLRIQPVLNCRSFVAEHQCAQKHLA